MSQTYTVISPTDASLKPPQGNIPDFQDPFSIQPYWIETAALGLIAVSIVLGLRIYIKIAIVKKCRWEDYTAVLGFMFFAAWVSQIFEVLKSGKGGAHQWNLTEKEVSQQHLFYNSADIVYSPAVGLTKISILLLVLRIFCPVKRDPFYWILQSLNILNTTFYAVYFIIPFVLCEPRKKAWMPQIPGHCLEQNSLQISSATFNIISDISMYSAPLWKIWHLQMSNSRKLGMSVVFATGGFAIAFAICRLIWETFLLSNPDFSYGKLQGTTFAFAELACGVICSSLFVLPRLYRHLTNAPPPDSEEYRLRRWKKLASRGERGVGESQLKIVKEREERRNPWERDIEIAGVPGVLK